MIVGSGAYVIRPARAEDAAAIAQSIRPVDIEEWEASAEGGVAHLKASITEASECWAACRSEGTLAPQIIGGINPGSGERGVAWLIGTPLAERDALWLHHATSKFWEDLYGRWPRLECWSYHLNTEHHRWLAWMGWRHVETVPWGHLGLPFHYFRRG